MRVTTSMYYRDLYAQNNKAQQQLFDVNKQISSGLKIQYAYEDTTAFSGTMRLDNEITGFEQIVKSVENGLKFSTQTDSTIGCFLSPTKPLTSRTKDRSEKPYCTLNRISLSMQRPIHLSTRQKRKRTLPFSLIGTARKL